jgi:hypothetical protein
MGRIFDDPCQQARQELLESSEEVFEQEDGQEETLSLTETFHWLLGEDPRDPEWEEINRKVLVGARPSDG